MEFEQRDLERHALAGALAIEQRHQHAIDDVHAGRGIDDGDAAFRRLFLGAVDREKSGLALHQQVVGLLLAIGAAAAIAGNVAGDQAGEARRQRRRIEPEPFCGARCEILQEHIRLRQQRVKHALALAAFDVEGEALLGAVGPGELARHPVHHVIIVAAEVALARPLDLDHPRAPVGEMPAGKGCCDRLLQRDDGDAGQRQIGRFPVHRLSPDHSYRFGIAGSGAEAEYRLNALELRFCR